MSEHCEFGKGLCYCLGLFLAHAERFQEDDEFGKRADMWFNGASDHLYELQVEAAPKELQPRLQNLQDKVLEWGHGRKMKAAKSTDVYWSIGEAKELLMLIDSAHGVPTEKAQWD